MKKVPAAKVVTTLEASESPLPAQIQEALGELDLARLPQAERALPAPDGPPWWRR